ncbi:MAG: hypothetical protein HP039_13525, partial [Bacteroides sp.]|nr:hypothetical protein [Bacteroides sp.]
GKKIVILANKEEKGCRQLTCRHSFCLYCIVNKIKKLGQVCL